MAPGGVGHDNLRVSGATRGQSEVLGMIILLTMVLVSAVVVGIAGSALIEDLQTRAQATQADSTIATVDQKLTQVVTTEEAASLSEIGTASQSPTVTEQGSATVAWIDENETSLPPPSSSCRVDVDPLGAVESPHETGTVAYQSGGVWRQTSSGTAVRSAPDISYDGNRLELGLVQITADDLTSGSTVAAVNSSTSRQLTTALERAARCGTARTVVIKIQSQYHEGWYSHLDSSLRGGSQTVRVEHDASSETVTARIERIHTTDDTPSIRSVGSTQLTETEADGRIEYGMEPITIETTLTATNSPVTTEEITVELGGESGVRVTETVTVRRGAAQPVTISVEPEAYTAELEPGQQYSYDILAGNTPLVTGGSVYVGASDPTFSLQAPRTDLDNGSLTIAAQLTNEGVTTNSASVSLQLVHDGEREDNQYDIDPVTVSRAPGATGQVSWRLSMDRLAAGAHTVRIETAEDAVTSSLTVPATDVSTHGSELTFERRRAVNVTVLGPEVSTEQRTEHVESAIVGGNHTTGVWHRTESGNATLDWAGRTVPGGPNVKPLYNDSGGWRPVSGSLQCLRPGDPKCELYGFPNTTTFEWSDDGGYELDWTYDQTGNWSWEGTGTFGEQSVYQKFWWPVTLDIGLEAVGSGRTTELSPWRGDNTSDGESLNQYHERNRIRRHSMTVDPGTRLSFEATSWDCGDTNWREAGQDTFAGGTGNGAEQSTQDWSGVWYQYDCTQLGDPILRVDSRTARNPENVRSRDALRDTIPELRAGAPRQQSADELLGDQFVKRHDNGTGVLDLAEDEFVFLFEITDQPDESVNRSEYFRQARMTKTPGDPNFNDLIVVVDLGEQTGGPAETGGELHPTFDTDSGEAATSTPGQSTTGDDDSDNADGVDVEIDGNAIVVR